jgi:hypothetical protein
MEGWVTGGNRGMAHHRKRATLCDFSANKIKFQGTAG